jgi:hypothetical protein
MILTKQNLINIRRVKMKKLLKIIVVGVLAVFLLSGNVLANPFNFYDNTINWPGWTPQYTADQIGQPNVFNAPLFGVTVTLDGNNNLQTVVMHMSGRQGIVDYNVGGVDAKSWDALFIRTGLTSKTWDYYVEDINGNNSSGATLYDVGSQFTYKLATQYQNLSGRWGHPAGIDQGLSNGTAASVVWNEPNNTLTYSFAPGIVFGQGFVIGYSEWCANDVVLTPEPGALLLLGLGLVGLGLVRRRMS